MRSRLATVRPASLAGPACAGCGKPVPLGPHGPRDAVSTTSLGAGIWHHECARARWTAQRADEPARAAPETPRTSRNWSPEAREAARERAKELWAQGKLGRKARVHA